MSPHDDDVPTCWGCAERTPEARRCCDDCIDGMARDWADGNLPQLPEPDSTMTEAEVAYLHERCLRRLPSPDDVGARERQAEALAADMANPTPDTLAVLKAANDAVDAMKVGAGWDDDPHPHSLARTEVEKTYTASGKYRFVCECGFGKPGQRTKKFKDVAAAERAHARHAEAATARDAQREIDAQARRDFGIAS